MRYDNKKSGFNLVELSVVLLVIGALIAVSTSGLKVQFQSSKTNSTQTQLEAIKTALENYRAQYGKYPCPSPANIASSNASYGVAATDCFTTCPSGITCNNSTVNNTLIDIAQGSVPFKTLGIVQELTVDSWGTKITYAVDSRFTQDMNRCEADGNITIQDYSNNSVSSKATYALISHGLGKKGGYSPESGALVASCDTSAKDGENCNNDRIFRTSAASLSNSNTLYYDDAIVFNTNNVSLYCPAGLTGCQVWYDASDKCTIIPNTGGVHRILNKTSSSFHAEQTSSSTRPDYSTNKLNNKNYITFNSANSDALYANVAGALSEGPYTIVTVFSTTSTNSTFNVITDSASFSALVFDRSHGVTGTFFRSYNQAAAGTQYITSTGAFNNGKPHVAINTVGTTGGSKLFIDGVSIGTQAGTASVRTSETTIILGSHTNLGAAGYDMMEYLYFNKELTDTERKVLEVYLAQKWGINY